MGWKCTKLLLFLQLVSCFLLSLFLLEPFWTLDLHRNYDERQDVEAGSGKMFDKIAKYYDSANTVMSMGNDHAWVLTHLLTHSLLKTYISTHSLMYSPMYSLIPLFVYLLIPYLSVKNW